MKPALDFEQSKAFTIKIVRFNIIGGQITALKRSHHKKEEKIIVRQITVALMKKNGLWKREDNEIVRLGKYEGDALTTGVTLETCCEVKEARLKRGCTV